MAEITVRYKGDFETVHTNAYQTDTRRSDWTAEDTRKFYRPNQWLSSYSLACGYMESAAGYTLYFESVHHVKGNGVWESFDTYTEAKKFFVKLVKAEIKAHLG